MKKIAIFLLILLLFGPFSFAQNCGDNAIYVTPQGSGFGSSTSPANLQTALALCKSDTSRKLIKLSTGVYTINQTLSISSNITVDGNYEVISGVWKKSETLNCTLDMHPESEEIKTTTSDYKTITVGHYIGFRLDSVKGITLRDFTLAVHKKNSYYADMTYDGYGKSVYGVFGRKSQNIKFINLHIVTDNGGDGMFGYNGLNGAEANYNVPGKTVYDQSRNTSYRPKPSPELEASYEFRAGGAGGTGGKLQRYYRCLDCPSTITSKTTSCALEFPLPTGGKGGKNGGAGGEAGDGCEMDCYYQYYKSKAFIKDELKDFLTVPSGEPKDPNPSAGANGTNGTGIYNGPDYTNQTILPYDDINYYYVPGKGEKGGDGMGGTGGGGGGAGGIRTLGLVPTIPGMGDYNLPIKMLGVFNKTVTLIGGDDVCNAEILNGSTQGGHGGAGGEGGEGGGGGYGGGGSFGVFMLQCKDVSDNKCVYTIGEGGKGGTGGIGGKGGEGGLGLQGNPVDDGGWSFQGATGGKGGHGGDGSRGQRGSNGRSIAKIGVSSSPAPSMMADVSTGCTNSVISIYTAGDGFLYNSLTGRSSDVPFIKDKPSGTTYTAYSNYVQVAVADTGMLPVSFSPNVNVPNIKSPVKINTLRALPGLNVPSVVCFGQTMSLTAATASAYVWKIYNLNNEVVFSSDRKTISYKFDTAGTYSVGYQAYDVCCGLSAPQYKTVKVSQAVKPTIKKWSDNTPYCYGSDSVKLEVTSPVQFSDVLKWTGGGTNRTTYAKEPGWYSVTLTTQHGCEAKSDSVQNNVFALPMGKPSFSDVNDACSGKEISLAPSDYEPGITYNFYAQGNNKNPLYAYQNGQLKSYFTTSPTFGFKQDTASYFVRKVQTYYLGKNQYALNCISDEVKEVKVLKEKYPPVVINDNAYRTLSAPGNSCGTYYTYSIPKAEDNCSPYITSFFKYKAPANYYHLGLNTDTIRYIDVSGNILDYVVNITVQDTASPVIISKPSSSTKEVSTNAGTCTAYYPFTLAKATDNCTSLPPLTSALPLHITTVGRGYVSVYMGGAYEGDSIFGKGKTTIYQAWSDSTGNLKTYEQSITVKDTEAPVLQCDDITYYVRARENTIFTSYSTPKVTDNCSANTQATFVSGFGQSGQHGIGTTTETWKATDAAGNTGYCTFKITVKDTIAPSIDCRFVQASAYTSGGTDSAVVTFTPPPASDNSGKVTVAAVSKGSGSYFKLGAHQVIYTATDSSGNSASCAVGVSVIDNQGPAVTCPTSITVGNDNGSCGAVINFTIANALDNDGQYYTPFNVSGLASGSLFPIGTTMQAYRANDLNGNSGFCTFTVTVKDSIAPVITNCPGNITENIDLFACGKSLMLPEPTVIENSCKSAYAGFANGGKIRFFSPGTSHVIYRATDVYNNTATCEYDVTIVDNTTLNVACPPNVEMNSTPGLCGAYLHTQYPKANLDYGCLDWSLVSSKGISDFFGQGEHTVTYQAKVMNQAASCSFTVKVNDKEPPVISKTANIVTHVDNGACGKVVTFTEPVATDNCTGFQLQLSKGLISGYTFPIGTTKQKYIAFDALNVDSAVFTITVLDTIAPVFNDQDDHVQSTADICGQLVFFNTPIATDNSSCFTVTQLTGLQSGDRFPLGITKQSYVVRDNAGNTDTTSFNVELTRAPNADFQNCPPDVLRVADNGYTSVVWYDIPGRSSCSGITPLLLSGKGSGATFSAGTTYESYLLTDPTGKTDTCTFRVIVTEMDPPYIICSEPYKFEIDESICGAKVKFPVPAVNDWGGSGLDTIFNNLGHPDSLIFLPVGYHQIIWTAVDNSGNKGYCYNSVSVIEDDRPKYPISNKVTVCEGAKVEIYPDMLLNGPYTYSWAYYDSKIPGYAVISTDSVFRIPSAQLKDGMQYVYRVVNKCDYMVYQKEFLLQVNPSPTVSLSGLNSSYCTYDSVGKAMSFSPAGGLWVGEGLKDGLFYPNGAGVGPHIVAYAYYDSTLSCSRTASLSVNVYATPEVKSFIDSAYCINNQPIQLDTANSFYSGPGISGTTFSAVLANAGQHAITRTVTVNGCSNSLTQTVQVKGNVPDATIKTKGPFCSNQSLVKLEAETAGGVWEGEFLYTDSNNVDYINVHKAGIGQSKIYHKVTEGVCTGRDSVAVVVKSSAYTLPYTFDAYCYDQGPVTLDVSDNKKYFGYGIENNVFNPASYDTSTVALYGISTLNANGCQDTTWRAMAILKPEISKPVQYICMAGDSLQLFADNRLASVKWFDNTSAYSAWVTNGGKYPVELKNTSGCIRIDTFQVYAKQDLLPSLFKNQHQLFKCINTGVTLAADTSFDGYTWSTGTQGNSITVNAPGTYIVYAKYEGCTFKDSIKVIDYPAIQNNKLMNSGFSFEAIEASDYKWYLDGKIIPGETGKTLTSAKTGDYYVSLLDSNGCESISDTIHILLTTLPENARSTECLIYPNPGMGKYTIALSDRPEEDIQVVIFNSLGEEVHQLKINNHARMLNYPINLEGHAAGVYWVHVKFGKVVKVVRLVKTENQ